MENRISSTLVNKEDSPLADVLESLIGNPGLRAKLGTAGRRIAEEEFSVEQVAAQTESVYEKLLNR